ncbi:MAG: hemerythrin domain-containing protein [Elusimicrobiota bacterium]|nr:hemerythrin domain-containing protein [Elusimicrobiota bacterium]
MGKITDYLAQDHDRLDALFTKAGADPAALDLDAYEAFRRGLLKHVGMEELILIPAARRLSGAAVALAERTRLDHGALTSLLIPSPTPAILEVLRSVLKPHNEMEERPEGLYEQCELALGAEADAVLERLRSAPDIPPAAHVDGPHVTASIRRALAAAGYEEMGRKI